MNGTKVSGGARVRRGVNLLGRGETTALRRARLVGLGVVGFRFVDRLSTRRLLLLRFGFGLGASSSSSASSPASFALALLLVLFTAAVSSARFFPTLQEEVSAEREEREASPLRGGEAK